MNEYEDFNMIEALLILLGAFLFLLFTFGMLAFSSPIRAITDTSLMCRLVYLAPAGRPDSIPCSSEIDPRCMSYQPKGSL